MNNLSKITDFAANQATAKYKAKHNAWDYKDFFVEAFKVMEPNTRYKHNWHVDYICNILQAETDRIARGEKKRGDLIINIMPRSLKSYLVTMLWNAWAWTKYPHLRFTTLSYSSPLSEEHSFKTRELIKSRWYQDNFGDIVSLSKSQDSKKYFANNESGERKASSVGGQVTGSGANILIFDDPVKPPSKGEYAINLTEINECNEWHDSTAFNRVNDPEVDLRVYVMQRLHNNDLTGHLLKKENQDYKVICIPGEYSNNIQPKEIEKNYKTDPEFKNLKVFFPERFPKRVLLNYEENMLENYSGQVLQSPTSKGGGTWKLEYFTKISQADLPRQTNRLITAWDLATSKQQKKDNSASAYVTGYVNNGDLYVIDFGYVWKDFPSLIPYMKKRAAPHYIENKSAGIDAVPTLKADDVDAYEVANENMDKFQHAAFASAKVKRLKVYVLDTIWDEFLGDNDQGKEQGVCEFPNATWDDVHDAFCIFIKVMTKNMFSNEDLQNMITVNRSAISSKENRSVQSIRSLSSGISMTRGSFRGNSI